MARRSRQACSPRITRRAPGSGSRRASTQAAEAALDFAGALAHSGAPTRLDLSPRGDLDEAAANLFAYLRALDAGGARLIAVAPIPERGLGVAINDRLRRAAAPRPPVMDGLDPHPGWLLDARGARRAKRRRLDDRVKPVMTT